MKPRSDDEHNAWMKEVQAAQEKKLAGKINEMGLLIAHTGKGKTSAAFGMAVRTSATA